MGETDILTLKLLEEILNNKTKDYSDIFQQWNEENNVENKNKLERKRKRIYEEMKVIEQDIEQIKQTASTPNLLLKILSPDTDLTIADIKKAYQACCPQGFSQQPNTVKDMLEILQDIQGDNPQFTPIACFVAHLVINSEMPKPLVEELQVWGRDNIKQFDRLLNDTKQIFSESNQPSDSYLLVKIKPLVQKIKYNKFQVSAWLIHDIENYQPEIKQGYKQLYVSDSLDDTYTLDDIPKILDSLLDQSNDYTLRNLTLEFFMPYELLSHPVDGWIKEEYGYSESIGKKYRVTIRAYERLDKKYRSKKEVLWREKWQKVKQACKCSETFLLSQNHDLETLRNLLDKAAGLILTKFPESTNRSSLFSVLLITATPVAICLRQEFKTVDIQDEDLIDFLECSILELPESVRKKRLDAPQGKDDHIGHHLSLIWEDPERLTPDAGYFYSLPQSVS